MPSTNIFTEEGRTRWRNFQRRLLGYVGVWLLVGIAVGVGVFWKFTRRNLEPLQRLYLKQYLVGSARSGLLDDSSSKYTLLVRTVTDPATGRDVTLGVTDDQAYPVRGENGRVLRDKNGYFFRPYPGLGYKYLYWKKSRMRDREMAAWLRQNIYDGTSFLGLFSQSLILGLMAFAAGTAGTIFIDRRVNRRYAEGDLLRGTESLPPKDYERREGRAAGVGLPTCGREERAIALASLRRRLRRDDGVYWLRIPREQETEHVLLLGDPGTGKSQIIHNFLVQIARRQPAETVVVYDPACEFVERHFDRGRGDMILNPLDGRCPFWSPAFEVKYSTDRKLIAESFFPGRAGETGTPTDFFVKASRNIFARMLEFDPTPAQVVEWLQDACHIDKMVEGTEHAHLIDKKAPNQRGGVLGSLSDVGETFRLLPGREECLGDISLTEWAKHRRGWIFITSTQDTRSQLRPLHAAFIDILMKRLTAVSPAWGRGHPCWVMVDEAHSLRRLPSLYLAETEGRKYGLKLVLGTQNKHQFDEHYGRSAPTMLSAPHLKIFLRCNEPESARWVSEVIGEDERERLKIGTTASVDAKARDSIHYSTLTERRAVVSKEEVMSLPNLHGYWKHENRVVPFRYQARDYRRVARGFLPREAIMAGQLSGPGEGRAPTREGAPEKEKQTQEVAHQGAADEAQQSSAESPYRFEQESRAALTGDVPQESTGTAAPTVEDQAGALTTRPPEAGAPANEVIPDFLFNAPQD